MKRLVGGPAAAASIAALALSLGGTHAAAARAGHAGDLRATATAPSDVLYSNGSFLQWPEGAQQ